MNRRTKNKLLDFALIFITLVMIVLRFLLNEKGRVSPDSIRYMRQAKVFPEIDNTTAPLLYPLSIKFFTFFGTDEFWASKIVGILAYLFIVFFAFKKKYFSKEVLLVLGLFSYLSIFSYTMSEMLILPFVFLFLYTSRQIIIGEIFGKKGIFALSLLLIILYNIRYSALFFMAGTFVFGIFSLKKSYAKTFMISAVIGVFFIIFYKFFFIDVFNKNYVNQFLEIGLKPTSKLLVELFEGLTTTFNPFIHIANPGGGIINIFIYGIGFINILAICFLFFGNKLSETEKFLVTIGVVGIICSYFIQYFYSVNPLDYRLLAPFVLGIWLVYFRKLFQIFGNLIFVITFLSFISGFAFTWLSRGNYLENRKEITQFLKSEKIINQPILFFVEEETIPRKGKMAELISTVNPRIYPVRNPKDTLKKEVLTGYKVLKKIKISKNKFQ